MLVQGIIYEPMPYGGVQACLVELERDAYLALIDAMETRQAMMRRHKAERAESASDSVTLATKLAMLSRHKVELKEIAAKIEWLKMGGECLKTANGCGGY